VLQTECQANQRSAVSPGPSVWWQRHQRHLLMADGDRTTQVWADGREFRDQHVTHHVAWTIAPEYMLRRF